MEPRTLRMSQAGLQLDGRPKFSVPRRGGCHATIPKPPKQSTVIMKRAAFSLLACALGAAIGAPGPAIQAQAGNVPGVRAAVSDPVQVTTAEIASRADAALAVEGPAHVLPSRFVPRPGSAVDDRSDAAAVQAVGS